MIRSSSDAGRHESDGCQQADVPFALGFPLGNLGEGGNSTQPDAFDPSPGLDDGGEQSIVEVVPGRSDTLRRSSMALRLRISGSCDKTSDNPNE
jgi:hypothetical protein